MKKESILYFFPARSTFIQKDLDILSEVYALSEQDFSPHKKALLPLAFLSQLFFLMRYSAGSSLIICRFAGYHSFLPALAGTIFRKPVLMILGGTESHSFPSIRYGNFVKKVYGWFTRQSLTMATHISPVDESLVLCDYNYAEEIFDKQGYRFFCPNADAPYTVIHNGYDDKLFFRKQDIEREANSFLTVAATIEGAEFYRKGIDLIFEVAPRFPELTFTVIGKHDSIRKETVPANVKLISKVPYEKLIDYYNAHEFYLQLSIAEGFPNALCEAMLCECVPIGSAVFGIPKIIGDCGFILEKKDSVQLGRIISDAISADKNTLSAKARKRISNEFPLEKRKQALLALVSKLIKA